MTTSSSRPNVPITAQPARDASPRRLIVTASVAIFAIRDWSLWLLLREGPWGPPMRLVLGTESVADAVERTIDALLMWPDHVPLIQLKAGWQEQQVYVWGSTEQGAAVSLIHSVLLRPNRDELRPNLQQHNIPSLRVDWTPVVEIESNSRVLDREVCSLLQTALHTLRSHVQRNPEIILQYLSDMGECPDRGWQQDGHPLVGKETRQFSVLKEPSPGDGTLTLAEAALLYRAFFPADEQVDLSNLRRRLLATNRLDPLDEERPVRGRELDWRRVSRAYRYRG